MALCGGLRFGMVQGRLIQSPPGQLQWFPQDFWESEFFIAPAVGIDFIELIAERDHNPDNPIWSDQGIARIQELTARNGLSLAGLCNDYVIDHPLPGQAEVLEQNFRLLEQGRKLGCSLYVLPLFEQSELSPDNAAQYRDSLLAIADKAAQCGLILCLETNLTGAELVVLLDDLAHPNIKLVYDTGNRVAFGHDLPGDIRLLGSRIAHVHIKDKNAHNQNVFLGTGLVDFHAVFQALAQIGYDGAYTFESQRGRDPVRTAAHNVAWVQFFHAEAARA